MRLIDADALIEEYDRVHVGEPGGARKLMCDAPTVEERKTGKWILCTDERFDIDYYKCSECGYEPYRKMDISNFCPNCGADMREGQDDSI